MDNNKKIKVIVVEDSKVKLELLTHIFNSDPNIEDIATASNGETAIKNIKEKKPDIVTMDINMPGINGFETTKRILHECPVPIVIISSIRTKDNREKVAKAMLECGALHFLDTPPGPWHPDFDSASKNIIESIKLFSEIKIFTRRKIHPIRTKLDKTFKSPALPKQAIIAIGASTGGPQVISEILKGLPANFKLPIIIVQHIGVGFDSLLSKNLNQLCDLKIKLATNREFIKPGTVYLATAGYNLEIDKSFRLNNIPVPEDFKGVMPSVDIFFNSVSKVYSSFAIGILLTGMGDDGAKGLKKMKDDGAVTIIQNEASSTVFGMPGEAKKIEAQKFIMSPGEIIKYLLDVNSKVK